MLKYKGFQLLFILIITKCYPRQNRVLLHLYAEVTVEISMRKGGFICTTHFCIGDIVTKRYPKQNRFLLYLYVEIQGLSTFLHSHYHEALPQTEQVLAAPIC